MYRADKVSFNVEGLIERFSYNNLVVQESSAF